MYQGYSYPGHQQAPQPAQFGHGAPVQAVAWNGEFSTKICPQQPFYSGPPPSQVAVVPTASCSFDLSAFAAMYNSHLATLTFNSKPIITNLTVIAHENVLQMANVIARCIDEHITQVRSCSKNSTVSAHYRGRSVTYPTALSRHDDVFVSRFKGSSPTSSSFTVFA